MAASRKIHDVFLSFRGEDTRTNFTSLLSYTLRQNSIKVYIDDFLEKGEDVWPSLSKAIDESYVAVVVFSINYASSKWCLEELVKILQCRKKEGQVVIPVFFEVDPSDIRNQTGSYGEAFAKHERVLVHNDYEDIVKKVSQFFFGSSGSKKVSQLFFGSTEREKVCDWRTALTEAANISGRDTRSREYKNQAEVIDKIVKDVMKSMEQRFPKEAEVKKLVGFDKFRKDMELLLSKNRKNQLFENVRVIGIWGMPGIGKTTIAKGIFSEQFPQYDGVCLLESVREASQNNSPLALKSLREKLLSEILKDENPKSRVTEFIARRLCTKRVFIVLDDVDSPEQLDELCEVCRHVGPGSKLIITTRDKHLLRERVDEKDIYWVKPWSYEESLELFSLTAFNKKEPEDVYKVLSERALESAGGVPLALKVLGSNLRARNTQFWESELEKIKNYPYDGIQKVLRVSYDGLDDPQKEILLDISFFFEGEYKGSVERILNACGFSATSGIQVLEDKALITISHGNRIQMHDLVKEMGWAIVRHGTKDPGRRSRLRDVGEVKDVLEYRKKGSDVVEGIQLDLSQTDDLHLNSDAFSMMSVLRFLKLYIPQGRRSGMVDYPSVFNEFSCELRYLEWNGYRLKSLPPTLNTKMLVEIHMSRSHITELWQGVKNVVNLEGIDLSDCKHLMSLPDLSKASKLRWVNLSGCQSLVSVHSSVLSQDTLEILILDGCEKLSILEIEKHLMSLKKISVNGCTNLKEFSVSSDSMTSLDLINAGIEKLHSSVGRSRNLTRINMESLRLENLPNEISFLTKLEELKISNCKQLVIDKQKLHALFDGLRNLTLLHLKDIHSLFELPENISDLYKLRELRLDGSNVETLPESIKHLQWFEILSLENCTRLKNLPELPIYIKDLNVVNCKSLVTVPSLKSFATKMIGKAKYACFENCVKLDESSLNRIMEDLRLAAINAIFHNELVRSHGVESHSHNYNFVKVCLPGSNVPNMFTYRTTDTSFIITLPSHPNMLGLVLCAVLSPSDEMKRHGAKIFCQFYKEDGKKVGYATRWHHEPIKDLNSDHVYIWYDALHFDSIAEIYGQKANVEFYVTNDLGERDVLDVRTKECGVHFIFHSLELPNLFRDLELDIESKWNFGKELAFKLGLKLGSDLQLEPKTEEGEIITTMLEPKTEEGEILTTVSEPKTQEEKNLTTIKISDKKECNAIDHHQRKHCCSCDCLFDLLSYFWRKIST